jgi:hypothetical protein
VDDEEDGDPDGDFAEFAEFAHAVPDAKSKPAARTSTTARGPDRPDSAEGM